MANNNKIKRDKRAYVAYLSYLLRIQKKDPNHILEGGIDIAHEIYQVEQTLKDLSFVIEIENNKAEAG